MGILRTFPEHAIRMALLAAAITIAIMAAVLLAFAATAGPGSSAPATVPVHTRPLVQTAPAWVADPLSPVTLQ